MNARKSSGSENRCKWNCNLSPSVHDVFMSSWMLNQRSIHFTIKSATTYIHAIIKYTKAYKTRLGKYSWLEQYVKPVVLHFLVYFGAPPFVQVSGEILFVLCSYSFPLLLRVDLLAYKTRINTIEHGCHVMARFFKCPRKNARVHWFTLFTFCTVTSRVFRFFALVYPPRGWSTIVLIYQTLKENRLVPTNMGNGISD